MIVGIIGFLAFDSLEQGWLAGLAFPLFCGALLPPLWLTYKSFQTEVTATFEYLIVRHPTRTFELRWADIRRIYLPPLAPGEVVRAMVTLRDGTEVWMGTVTAPDPFDSTSTYAEGVVDKLNAVLRERREALASSHEPDAVGS
jgi:Bacterial PH domain